MLLCKQNSQPMPSEPSPEVMPKLSFCSNTDMENNSQGSLEKTKLITKHVFMYYMYRHQSSSLSWFLNKVYKLHKKLKSLQKKHKKTQTNKKFAKKTQKTQKIISWNVYLDLNIEWINSQSSPSKCFLPVSTDGCDFIDP